MRLRSFAEVKRELKRKWRHFPAVGLLLLVAIHLDLRGSATYGVLAITVLLPLRYSFLGNSARLAASKIAMDDAKARFDSAVPSDGDQRDCDPPVLRQEHVIGSAG